MNNNCGNRELDCDIVCDLLPLYHDGVVSDTTAEKLEKHLTYCDFCRTEYETLCTELPIEAEEVSTKERFRDMVKKMKRKRNILTVIIVILLCAVLVGGYFLQMQFPIANVPDDEISVHRVYRYETEQGYKFFVLYSLPCYNYITGDISVEKNADGDTLVMDIKKPLIAQKYEKNGLLEEIWVYKCGYSSGDNGSIEYVEFDNVEFGGKIAWSEAENADDTIPDYVYAYEEFEQPGGEVTTWVTEVEKGYLAAGYSDGHFVSWDLDGNVIYDGYPDEK